jgi:hypothetical protein
MASAASSTWYEANQRYLSSALDEVRHALQQHIERMRGDSPATPTDERPLLGDLPTITPSPALALLSANFHLSVFERSLLLLCAAVELDASFTALCAAAHNDPQRPYPTLSLALAALPGAHWSALTPVAPLRRWRMIEIGAGSSLTLSPLRIDERVLHYLAGASHLDERLIGMIEPVSTTGDLVPSHRALADQVTAVWLQAHQTALLPAIQLIGVERSGKRAIAAAICAALDLKLSVLSANALPTSLADIEIVIRLWEREAALGGSALLVDCDDLDTSETARASAVTRLIEHTNGALLLASRERRHIPERPTVTFEVHKPSSDEQRTAWHLALGDAAERLNGHVDLLIGQFNLEAQAIRAASVEALGLLARSDEADLGRALWNACRIQARPRLDDLAQRIDSSAVWDELVLPEAQRQVLRDIAAHVRQRARVYETWGFAGKGTRGLGISALFAGASGTGKTMAAEVLANELHLDVYRIDLSAMVSKYIGETEKNLRRVFDAAEAGGAILLFDEADALFGKRSEVKDSHDRYANIEVSYLLQRMEAYRGLAILTTNLKSALDTAFLRRLRFVVQFPFPDAVQRAEIWRRIFPRATPTEGLDAERLARLNVAGGNIRNIALNAAFLAADEGAPVRMYHLLRAARAEYAKLEKSLAEAEITGWI